jgi:hypothetical protein
MEKFTQRRLSDGRKPEIEEEERQFAFEKHDVEEEQCFKSLCFALSGVF